jgi:hypothetical protein
VAETSTLTGVRTSSPARYAFGRRLGLSLLLVIVLAGASGWLGVKAHTTSRAGADGYRLTLTYPQVARAGLDVPWELRLSNPAGFTGPITIAVTASYFDIFEYQDLHPEAESERSTGHFVYLTFSKPPDGATAFTVSLDTYVQPASQIGRHATLEAFIGQRQVATLKFTTVLMP